ISVQTDVPRSDAVRGERAPFPPGVGIREDRHSQGLHCTCWHTPDARKRILGTAQPRINEKLTTPHREPNRPAKSRHVDAIHRTDTWSSRPVRPSESCRSGPAPKVFRVPKLSVIVPFHNVRPHAPDTLRSLRLNARPD